MSDLSNNPIRNFLRYRFNLDDDKADEGEIIENIERNIEFKGTNLWTLIFAILIASIGLNVNSTAVIIGAMLISPLMGPIMGIGLGVGIFDFRLVKKAFKNLVIAAVISLAASTFYFWITPLDEARSELLARTTPTIWDVMIAVFGGLAGIIASTRKNISNAIPGVAIATALMPPLCTAGYGLGNGEWYYFFGAFYLFLINCVFISISTFIIVKFLGFHPRMYVNEERASKVKRNIWIIAVLTILPSLYLAYQFVKEELFNHRAQDFITNEIKARNLYVIDKFTDPGEEQIKLVLFGDSLDDTLAKRIVEARKKYGLSKADIKIRQTLNASGQTKNAEEFRGALQKQVLANDLKIDELAVKVKQQSLYQTADSTLYREFFAIFGKTKELAISRTLMHADNNKKDTVLLVYYSPLKRNQRLNHSQMENWLKERTKSKNVIIAVQ